MTKCPHCDATVLSSATPAVGGEDARYWEFRKVVEELVFDPIRRGGLTEAEIVSQLRIMSDEHYAAQPASPLRGRDSELLDWLNEQIVSEIYLDDGRLIDVRGNDVRTAIRAVADLRAAQPASPLRGRGPTSAGQVLADHFKMSSASPPEHPAADPLREDHSALAVRLGHMSKWFTDQSYEATTLREAQAALASASPPEQPAAGSNGDDNE